MSYVEGPYAFAEGPDLDSGSLLYAEAGLYHRKEIDYNDELDAKLGTASFKVGKTKLGVNASAQAEYGSISRSTKDSMEIFDHTIDFKAELAAKGPSVGAEAELGLTGVNAKLKAELASASSSVGVFSGKVGLAADTGLSVGLDGVEVSVLGTGVSLWPNTGFTIFGTGVSIDTRTAVDTILSWF